MGKQTNKKINLYLDDERKCPHGFYLARTFEEAVEVVLNNEVNIISLDHDLGAESNGDLLKTGYDFAKYLCENGVKCNEIYIHTANPVGRENIYQTLVAARSRGFINEEIKIYRHGIV